MEKNIILSGNLAKQFANGEYRQFEPSADVKFLIDGIKSAAGKMKVPVEWLRKYYSTVLEKEISMKQTALLLETQFAFTLGVIPADIHFGLRACFLGWFAWCLLKCKKAFKDA